MQQKHLVAGVLLVTALGLVVLAIANWQRSAGPPEPVVTVTSEDNPADPAYPGRDWHTAYNNSLNISVFVYRDSNRSGDYDLGDLPIAGVAVDLLKSAGSAERERTNVSGYANFRMHNIADGKGIVRQDAPYHFDVQVPEGWQITSGNARQSSRFRVLSGSPAGLVAESPPDTVGLAPRLTLSGTVDTAGDMSPPTLHSPEGHARTLALDAGGDFLIEVYPGTWVLEGKYRDGSSMPPRTIAVSDVPVRMAALRPTADKPPSPKLRTVTASFDDLPRAEIEKLPRGHLGLDWDYLLAVHNQTYGGPGYVNGMHSPPGIGYNSSGHPVTIAGLNPGDRFDFVGGYLATAWPASEGDTLNVTGWRGEEVVYQDKVSLSHLGALWFQADYRDIDRLTLASEHYWQFVADDLVFRLPANDRHSVTKTLNPLTRDSLISQYDLFPGRDLREDFLCAPAAAAMGLSAIDDGRRGSESVVQLARELARENPPSTHSGAGNTPGQLMQALRRYLQQYKPGLASLRYAGWRPVAGQRLAPEHVTTDWLRAALANGAAVLLNIGAYAEADDGNWRRVSGHWINLLAVDGNTLQVHDPAPREVNAQGFTLPLDHRGLLVSDMSRQRFIPGDLGAPVVSGLPRAAGADLRAIDAAIAIVPESRPER